MVLAGIAGYMMMNRGNSGFGGLGQGQSTEQAPTGYSVPSTWSQDDFNKSLQKGDSYHNTKFYAHEIHSWYTTRVFTNNPSDMNARAVWENVGSQLRRQFPDSAIRDGMMNASPNQVTKVEAAVRGPDGHFYVWQKRYLLAVTAAMEKELMAKVQPIANRLITTTEYLNQVVMPASSILSSYVSDYYKGHLDLLEGTKDVTINYPAIPN
jgi:hypothetical protein